MTNLWLIKTKSISQPPPLPSIRKKTHDPYFLLRPTVVLTQNLNNSRINSAQTLGLNFKAKSLDTVNLCSNLSDEPEKFRCSSPQRERAGRHLVWTRTYDLCWTNLLHIPPCDQLIDENTPVFHIIHTTESYRFFFSSSSFTRKIKIFEARFT